MNTLEARRKVTEIFIAILQRDPRYWREDTWIRWARIERDVHAIIDELQPSSSEEPLAANRSRPAIQPTSITGRRVNPYDLGSVDEFDKFEYPQRSK